MFLTIITFIAVLSLLVFVHELGHFWTAKKFGLIPKEFGFGFPPRAFGYYKDKEGKWKKVKGKKEVKDAAGTIYSINWILLGGFVMLGEDDIPGDNPNHFNNQPIWKRFIILSAGVSMNIFLAVILISVGLMIGLPQVTDGEDIDKAIVSNEKIQILEVLDNSPAQEAGLKTGDIILGVDNNKFVRTEALQDYIKDKNGQEVSYLILRGQEEINLNITPVVNEEIREEGKAGIGIAIVTTGLVKYPWYYAIWEGIKNTFILTWTILVAFFDLIVGIFSGKGVGADIAGPVGIASLTGQVARMGFVYVLQFTALLSINLAILNFLPFPALDGGRVVFLLIEKIKGSPVKKEVEALIHNTGFALLMLLVLIVTIKDLSGLGGYFMNIFDRIF
jgi:regulator of sigma E protease